MRSQESSADDYRPIGPTTYVGRLGDAQVPNIQKDYKLFNFSLGNIAGKINASSMFGFGGFFYES